MISSVEQVVEGQHLMLLPERAALWRERNTLLVADVHFGKAAAFRSASVPVPAGTTALALARLDLLISATEPHRIVFLGDLWHAKTGRTEQVVSEVGAWRQRHSQLEMVLVEGNHDLRSGRLPAELSIDEVADPFLDGPFVLRHEPEPQPGAYAIGGHIHPCVELVGRANQSLRLPCFIFSHEVAILPAFGEFTGCAEVVPNRGDAVYVVAEGRVIPVGKAKAITA